MKAGLWKETTSLAIFSINGDKPTPVVPGDR
jgi:hypothetical protein